MSNDLRDLIRKTNWENPLRGAPRIHGELLKVGSDIGETSVGEGHGAAAQAALDNLAHSQNYVKTMVSVDFFTVPTIRIQLLWVSLVLAHGRCIVHFNLRAIPTAEWTAQHLRGAFPFDEMPQYLLRNRDGIFGSAFSKDVKALGLEEVLSAPGHPGNVRTWNA